jgi:osomolarity two-component system, sensor histidine kinase SLN1
LGFVAAERGGSSSVSVTTSEGGGGGMSRPGSMASMAGTATAGIGSNATSTSFEQDLQPRLVGLSHPFFAAAPLLSSVSAMASSSTPGNQLQGRDDMETSGGVQGKIRVLVAEDNLVNQEVVLR